MAEKTIRKSTCMGSSTLAKTNAGSLGAVLWGAEPLSIPKVVHTRGVVQHQRGHRDTGGSCEQTGGSPSLPEYTSYSMKFVEACRRLFGGTLVESV